MTARRTGSPSSVTLPLTGCTSRFDGCFLQPINTIGKTIASRSHGLRNMIAYLQGTPSAYAREGSGLNRSKGIVPTGNGKGPGPPPDRDPCGRGGLVIHDAGADALGGSHQPAEHHRVNTLIEE